MSKALAVIVTDLHLSENQEDQYRFGLFDWLIKEFKGRGVADLFILGDLTDRKDNHSAWFVNKITENLVKLTGCFNVHVLMGNHDYMDPSSPFFKFLGRIKGIFYYHKPAFIRLMAGTSLRDFAMLPHTRDPSQWRALQLRKVHGIMMHHTFKGAIGENGFPLDGMPPSMFSKCKGRIFSGDVHVPQVLGHVTYVGTPYHIHFGDSFTPRVLLLDGDLDYEEFHFPAPRKFMLNIKSPSELKKMRRQFSDGDRAKVRLHLRRSEFEEWPEHRKKIKKICERYGLVIHSLELKELKRTRLVSAPALPERKKRSPVEMFNHYCEARSVDKNLKLMGSAIMKAGRD